MPETSGLFGARCGFGSVSPMESSCSSDQYSSPRLLVMEYRGIHLVFLTPLLRYMTSAASWV